MKGGGGGNFAVVPVSSATGTAHVWFSVAGQTAMHSVLPKDQTWVKRLHTERPPPGNWKLSINIWQEKVEHDNWNVHCISFRLWLSLYEGFQLTFPWDKKCSNSCDMRQLCGPGGAGYYNFLDIRTLYTRTICIVVYLTASLTDLTI
jgi:hypothetical protein